MSVTFSVLGLRTSDVYVDLTGVVKLNGVNDGTLCLCLGRSDTEGS